MEKSGEQSNTSEVEESNLFQWERGKGRLTRLINKGRVRIWNNQSDQLIGNLIVEQNICNKETGRRIEENNGLPAVEYIAKISAIYNERFEQGVGNMEEKRLGMFDGHQISVQSCGSNWRIGEIPSIYAQGNPLYAGGNAIQDLDSTEDLRKDNTNNNRQSEKQESSSYNKLCRRHSISYTGSVIVREGNGVDSKRVQEIWMGHQREEEQVEAGVTVCIPVIDVQLNIDDDLIDQREKEGTQSISSKVDKTNNGRKNIKDQKRSKFGWQAQVFHSIIQTRRTASIANKQIYEQSSESNGLDKRNYRSEEVLNRTILVDDIIGKQQTKDDRQETERDNNLDGSINDRMGSECDQEQHQDQEYIRIMGSEHGKFQSQRDTGDIQINTIAQGIYQSIGIQLNNDRNRQYNSVRGKWMEINNKTYRWEEEQRSGRVIKVVDGRGLFNKKGVIGQSSEGLVSGNNSGSIYSKEQCQTQEIQYVGQGQKSGRMRFNEGFLGGGVCINTPTDTNGEQSNKENSRGESSGNSNSTPLARIALVDAVKGDSSERERSRREREGFGDGSEDEEEESESSSGEDVGFRGKRGQDGARLFRSALEASGLSRNAIRSIIDNWHGSWRRHACALSAFWEYLIRKGVSIEQLARVEKPYIIIAEYITDIVKDQSDAFVIQARTSVSTIENKRALTPEECSKEVHIVMNNAGIDKKFSVTTIRKVAISAMQNKDKTKIEIDRWSRHSESADTVRENYDVNNNDSIRKALSECVS
ncbi:MAG: hypothetical protein EZS28_035166, partial [Streblomastix strix]